MNNRFRNVFCITAILALLSTTTVAGEFDSLYKAVTWGPATNGIQVGVQIPEKLVLSKSFKNTVLLYLWNNTSSNLPGFFFPDKYESVEISLMGSDGKEVKKTALGRKFGKPLRNDARLDDKPRRRPDRYWSAMLFPQAPSRGEAFDLLELFRIETPGRYDLIIHQRLYHSDSKGALSPFLLLPVKISIQLGGG